MCQSRHSGLESESLFSTNPSSRHVRCSKRGRESRVHFPWNGLAQSVERRTLDPIFVLSLTSKYSVLKWPPFRTDLLWPIMDVKSIWVLRKCLLVYLSWPWKMYTGVLWPWTMYTSVLWPRTMYTSVHNVLHCLRILPIMTTSALVKLYKWGISHHEKIKTECVW